MQQRYCNDENLRLSEPKLCDDRHSPICAATDRVLSTIESVQYYVEYGNAARLIVRAPRGGKSLRPTGPACSDTLACTADRRARRPTDRKSRWINKQHRKMPVYEESSRWSQRRIARGCVVTQNHRDAHLCKLMEGWVAQDVLLVLVISSKSPQENKRFPSRPTRPLPPIAGDAEPRRRFAVSGWRRENENLGGTNADVARCGMAVLIGADMH